MHRFKYQLLIGATLLSTIPSMTPLANDVHFTAKSAEIIEVKNDTLYPEGITFNQYSNRFVLGSFRHGAIFEIDNKGNTEKIIDDNRLRSVFAVRIDHTNNRLYALTSDLGASTKSIESEAKRYAALIIYDLKSKQATHFIDLSALIPNSNHLANGMAIDEKGNAYITDSFASAIYNVDTKGKAELFLKHNEFDGIGINLNGIVYHPNGYLLAVKKSNGALYKVPLDKPKSFSKVKADRAYIGADGLVLASKTEIIIIANRASGQNVNTAFSLSSKNDWQTMKEMGHYTFGDVYPTTGVLNDGNLYVVHSHLNELVSANSKDKPKLRRNAIITQIGGTSNN